VITTYCGRAWCGIRGVPEETLGARRQCPLRPPLNAAREKPTVACLMECIAHARVIHSSGSASPTDWGMGGGAPRRPVGAKAELPRRILTAAVGLSGTIGLRA
jgi:hypothetical protein